MAIKVIRTQIIIVKIVSVKLSETIIWLTSVFSIFSGVNHVVGKVNTVGIILIHINTENL